jgi:tetratricopeptide (TPR) repeat protein
MQKMQNFLGQATAMCNLGIAFIKLERYAPASAYLQIALEIFRAIQDRNLEEQTLVELIKVYCALGEYDKAIAYNHQHLDILQAASQELTRSQA